MFVIRNKTTQAYMTGGRTSYSVGWNTDINKARVFGRKCDASNSITGHFGSYYYRNRPGALQRKDLEVVEVNVSVHDTKSPHLKVDISPEILERATRYMMIEQATGEGAPKSLIDSFKDLDTNTLVKLVTTLYGKK